jgi:hypothetical protein
MERRASEDPRLRYFRHPTNLGAFANFSFGLRKVTTEFFSVLSDDDLLLPGFYESTLQALDANPDPQFAATRVVYAEGAGNVRLEDTVPAGLHEPPGGLVDILEHGHPS